MDEDVILRKLRALKPRFGEMKIKRVRVFGSFARGEAHPGSDIDLLVEFLGKPTLLDVAAAKEEIEDHVGRRVDLVTLDSIYEALKDRVLQEARDV